MIWPWFFVAGIVSIIVGCGLCALDIRDWIDRTGFVIIAIGAILILTSVFFVVAEQFSG